MSELKLVYEPEVYLVSRPKFDESCFFDFEEDEGVTWESDSKRSGEVIPEVAGRLCYMSFSKPRPGGNTVYLRNILDSGHGSVLEHSSFSFIFTGISRSLSHELVRHRIGVAISQLSQRYVDEADCRFVVPWELRKEVGEQSSFDATAGLMGAAGDAWISHVRQSQETYELLVEYLMEKLPEDMPATDRRKAARATARSVLPNCTETKMFWTANCRTLRHCIEQRCNRHAEVEIRRLFGKVHEIMLNEAPALFSDYARHDLPDGTFELTTPYRKV